jgi:1,2-diacylglycerol 3-alpha-glucosyltransferase
MRDALRSYGVRRPISVIPTGLDMEAFRGGDGHRFRTLHGVPAQRSTLVYVGRVAFEKNIDFLLLVVQQVRFAIPDVLLVVAGEDPAASAVRRQAQSLGVKDNVRFVGYASRDRDLLDCYRAGDVSVFASRTETQGLVLLEAMALGMPVVSTAKMGTQDILRPGCGALIAEEEVEDFSEKVTSVLRDPKLRLRLGEEASRYAERWSSLALAKRLEAFYQDVIARHGRTRVL